MAHQERFDLEGEKIFAAANDHLFEAGFDLLHQCHWDRRAPAADLLETREVVSAQLRVLEEGQQHGWGCGLIQAVILTTSYAEQFAHHSHVASPEERSRDWQRRNNGWVAFYRQWLSAVTPKEPVPNQVMEKP